MRRLRFILGVVLICLSVPSLAENQVESVRIDVELQDDGSAFVKETWVIDVDSDITEWYLGKENLGKMKILDLGVTDESGTEFFNEGTNWNINRSREKKAFRCGLVKKSDGYEVCWGVGSNGLHTFTVTYTLTGLVKGYSDKDGFNFQFITSTDNGIDDVSLTIRKNGTILTPENTLLWGFGFHGEAEVVDGAAKYWSTEPFSSRSTLIALLGFEKGIFTPELTEDKTFDDVRKKALKGSEYKKDNNFFEKVFDFLLFAFLGLISLALVGGLIWAEISNKKRRKELLGGKESDVDWFRGVPVDGDLKRASNIIRLISQKTFSTNTGQQESERLISAYMMRLFYRGAFQLVPQLSGDPAFKINELTLTDNDVSGTDLNMELDLYNFFKEAAGDDSILQKKELRKWANKHGKKIYNWQNKIKDSSITLKTLTAKEVREVFGLKKFLKDFTLIQDRGAVEVGLWNNYLIFASLYGIAEQVYKDFKKVCPEYFTLSKTMEQFQDVTPTVMWSTFNDSTRYFNRAASSYAASKSSGSGWSGGGGHTSFGGGGGFSGGGHSGGR
ncbi:MAG: DUF2207 domain-containing protein [Bacteroidales bacterium]|nr:DUF2207 domain-containing protein [Bacteroidales bacterium]